MTTNPISEIYDPLVKRIASLKLRDRRELAESTGVSEAAIRLIGNGKTQSSKFRIVVSLHQALFPDQQIAIIDKRPGGDSDASANNTNTNAA